MSDTAKQRIEALGNQLSPPKPATSGTPSPAKDAQAADAAIPAVKRVAGPSAGPRLAGKVAIVTGANSPLGIGRATALQFAENGARAVYLCDVDETHLAAHKREMEAASGGGCAVHVRRVDAADEAAVEGVVRDAVARYGRLDVFFANAGVAGRAVGVTETTRAEFAAVLDTNAASAFLAVKHGAPAMAATAGGRGSIVATASVAGLRANAGPTAYSASKAAVIAIAQTAAFQLAGSGVRVNALCPGLVETGMTAPTFAAARARGTERRVGQLNPLRRAGHADEIARAALFLASDEASYVNGQAWAVDGGLSAGHPFVPGKLA
ncbi:NAD(P)-binding protein [Durotheca rogersii]|uniref:NAD(P)-binding protein n=1 Tax=Durotheca rogersii TaxID=419775 RepID=UPI00221EE32A|nr:NAD(P)-binding protein [Durotheca rogersii]KAI5860360.1 NAD(P)-binding protein [Durotheca rogersii]